MVEMYSEFHLTIKKNGIMPFVRKWLQSEVNLLKPEKKYISLSCLNTHALIHTHTSTYIHIYTHMHTYTHACTHTHRGTYIHIHV